MRLPDEALNALDPSMPREQWVRMAFAYKDAGGTLEAFLAWSERAPNFDKADAVTTWRNAKSVPGGVTEATLFMEARRAGWKPEPGGNGAGQPLPAPSHRPRPVAVPDAPAVDPNAAWEAAAPTIAHPYLTRKGIAANGARVTATGALVVPFVSVRFSLQTLQFVAPDGTKRFLKGARQKGAVAFVGDWRGTNCGCIAEGFATACAIHEATGFPAMAAGSRGTMPDAARIAREWAGPDARLVICADVGDLATPIAAARAVGATLAVPGPADAADGFDFCDWRIEGATQAEVRARIEQAPGPAAAPQPQDAPLVDHGFRVIDGAAAALASAQEATARPDYIVDDRRRVVMNLQNVRLFLESGDLGEFALDTFTGLQTWKGAPIGDVEYSAIAATLQRRAYIDGRHAFAKVPTSMVVEAVSLAANANAFNSNVRWLQALEDWDGVERIDAFLSDITGAAGTPYVRMTSRYLWLSLVSRMVRPGCSADMVPVLIGAQGVGKSTLGSIIGGERYGTASLARIGERDWFAGLRGKILVEFSELSGHTRAEMETIKAIITQRIDEYRPAYARVVQSVPRGCIFYGTTNDSDFLIDASGNRRYLPVVTQGQFALDAAADMRAQCFAEAFALVQAGNAGSFWLVPGALEQQAAHVVADPWVDLLDSKLRDVTGDLPERIETSAVYDALKIPAERQTGGGTGRRIVAAMRALGFDRDRWQQGPRVVRGFALVVLPVKPGS